MKKISLLAVLTCAISIGHTQDLQTVTDNGNLTTNELRVKGDDKPVTVSLTTYNYSGNPIGAKLGAWSGYGTAGIKFHRWRGSATNFQVAYLGQMNYNGDYGLDFRTNSVSTLTDATTSRMFISSNTGNIGIGITTPEEKLHIKNGNTLIEMDSQYGNDPRILFQNDGTGANPYQTFYRWTGGANNYYATRFYEGGNQGFKIQNGNSTTYGNHTFTDAFVLLKNGNIGIGISSPTQKLQVAGTVYSTEVKVELAAGQGPDYVFEPDYELRTLLETKEYITKNKHLPEIPSAKEMETNGVDLGDMNMRLLRKIEELTLYQIELLEKVEELQSKVENLENK